MKENQREKLLKRLKKKAASGGRAAAIDLTCAQCIYDSEALGCGSWRSQTGACTSVDCGLYKYRPQPIAGEEDED